MAIPNSDPQDDVPPPLPPPRHPPCTNAPYRNDDMLRDSRDRAHPGSSFSSGYGSVASSLAEDRPRQRRGPHSNAYDDRDEGYSSLHSNERSLDSFPSRFGLHHSSFQFQSPADIHGDSMKKKLNPLRTSEKPPSVSLLSASSDKLLSRRPGLEPRYPPELSMPVKLPYHPRVLDSPLSLTDPSPHSAVSPRSAPFGLSPADHRSPQDGSDVDRSPRARTHRNNSDDASSTQGSYDFAGAEDMDMDDAPPLRRLTVEDGYTASGQKRRAGSPPAADGSLLSQNDGLRRRDAGTRGSPAPRLTTSGLSLSRSSSYVSVASMAPSTTTANSYEHRSPGAHSSGGVSPTSGNSPYTTPMSLNPSPRGSISARTPVHTRNVSSTTPRRLPEMQKPGGSKVQGFFMCECCPKKPKKFETHEELRTHESEKQYNCSYCGNRFKNKNEAERHQNSLHVRRHSWSCSALSGYDRAFHEATSRPGAADTCGYCGRDFHRSGVAPNGTRFASDQDWDDRIRHLQDVHKFRECNSSKKFYRADHFRQHLKHSHQGSSGKWTNMLENACMIEEEPPTPR